MAKTTDFEISWQSLVEAAPDGVCVVDARGTVRYANPAALDLLGLKAPDGALAAEWLADLDDPNCDLLLKAIADRGQMRFVLPKGAHKHLFLAAEPLEDTDDTLIRVRRDYEVEGAETTAILVHDLRLPMTSIMGYSKMLLTVGAESLNDTQRQFLDTIERNVQRLESNLSAAQDMTRIDRGRINLTLDAQSPASVAAQVLDEFQPSVAEKGHKVDFEFADDLPPVQADLERLKQILRILLDNAVKYTPSGGEIRLRGRVAGEMVQIDIQDNGLGIDLAEQGQIFSKFFRGEDERIREYHGLGLSLYIARGLTQLQGGRLWFESTPGQGSTFSFTLPMSKVT
jgi:signal transduction histidine kinase